MPSGHQSPRRLAPLRGRSVRRGLPVLRGQAVTRAALIAALTLATIAGLCALALHPALYPNATDTNLEGI